jgi:hypothetical protein
MLGREVATLVNSTMYSGSHTLQFNGTGLPNGMYVYQLKTPQGVISNTMVLNR